MQAGLGAYLIWGSLTVYWKQLHDFGPAELIAWRVTTAALVMAVVVSARRRWSVIRTAMHDRTVAAQVVAAALLLTVNWGAYVYAVVNDRVIETALGYFIAPLGMMAMGIVLLGERPSRGQKVAMALGGLAIVELAVVYGRVPVLAILIAASWCGYSLTKRRVPLTGLDSFAAESFVLAIPAFVAVGVFTTHADSIPRAAATGELVLVALSGIVTAVPLSLFAYAAVRVPFTTLGSLQYLVPTINFALGWLVYDEALPWTRLLGFGLVWVALAVVTVDMLRDRESGLATATP
jgi:chloramphenicol-sensitive protein RarD